jgi:hypothetical protein
VLLILTPVWKWAVVPSLKKIPDTVDQTLIYEGVLTLNVDPTTMAPLPAGMEVKVPLTITRKDVSDKAKGTSSVAVIREPVVAKGPASKDYINYIKYYALDRKTGKNVPGNNSDMNRTDYSIMLGFDVTPNGTYKYFDDDTAKAAKMNYVKSDTMDGFDYKGVKVLQFTGTGSGKTTKPPLGMPAKISGAQIKTVLNNPGLPFADTEMYPIDYIKNITATIRVDERTGSIFDVMSMKEEYFVDATALGMGKIKLATIQYSQTPASVKQNLDEAASSYKQLDMVEKYIPLLLLILGVILLVIGVVLILVKKPAEQK